ncbi:fibroleukin isoform 2-T2 [Fundulus diaphanus]
MSQPSARSDGQATGECSVGQQRRGKRLAAFPKEHHTVSTHSCSHREVTSTGLCRDLQIWDQRDWYLYNPTGSAWTGIRVFALAQAKCDMETVGGGWTVIQNRQDGSVDFNRTWQEYREGFGSLQGEHWLGNAALHALTSTGQHQLRIELEDWYQQKRHATYSNFKVASEAQRYRLTAHEYSGDAGNALSYSKHYNHDGRPFSTADRDHDRYASGNCGQYYGAGWWFDACLAANLNGRYYHGRYTGLTNGIYWGTWYILTDGRTGERYSFKRVEMKTRPKNFGGTK